MTEDRIHTVLWQSKHAANQTNSDDTPQTLHRQLFRGYIEMYLSLLSYIVCCISEH